MAWTEFYIINGGNNANAGSSTAAVADVTSTNGGWSTATNIFTAAAGTPFSGVTANTDWASVYVDGGTVCVFTALVTAVGGGGASVTLSTTARLGTPPATSATARSCKINGSWADMGVMTSAVLTSGTAGTPMRINWKQNGGTFSNTTNTRTLGAAGTVSNPIWLRGYNTTPGDCDTDYTLATPLATFTSGRFTISGAHWITSSIQCTASNLNNSLLNITGANFYGRRVGSIQSTANSSARAISLTSGAGQRLEEFYAIAAGTADAAILTSVACSLVNGYLNGGIAGILNSGSNTFIANGNIFNNTGSYGIDSSGTGHHHIQGNSFYNLSADGVRLSGNFTLQAMIFNNLFSTITGVGVNITGSPTSNALRGWNAFYNCGGTYTGQLDMMFPPDVSLASDPFTNVAGNDFSLVQASAARGAASPFTFWAGSSGQSYLDIGAVQSLEASSGGGGLRLAGHGGLAS